MTDAERELEVCRAAASRTAKRPLEVGGHNIEHLGADFLSGDRVRPRATPLSADELDELVEDDLRYMDAVPPEPSSETS